MIVAEGVAVSAALELVCVVCAEVLTSTTEAYCMQCGQPYHLSQRTDVPERDCGQVWVNEEHLSLEFACDVCLAPSEAAAGLDDVLDLEEAAAAAGLTPGALEAAATAGQVPHRKTSGGVLLFLRRDVQGLAGH